MKRRMHQLVVATVAIMVGLLSNGDMVVVATADDAVRWNRHLSPSCLSESSPSWNPPRPHRHRQRQLQSGHFFDHPDFSFQNLPRRTRNRSLSIRGGAAAGYPSSSSSAAAAAAAAGRSPFGIRPSRQQQQQQQKGSNSRSSYASPSVLNSAQQPQKQQQQQALSTEQIDAFLTRDTRQRFIAKVYFILSCQLLITLASIFFFSAHPRWARSMFMNRGSAASAVPMLGMLLSTVAWFRMASSPEARRRSPTKWQWLGLFTAGESLVVGLLASLYPFASVLTALGATASATIGISAYTFWQRNPKYDLSQWGAGLSSAGMIFLVYALVHLLEVMGILPAGFLPYRELWFSAAGATLFSFYLAYHTKLIVGGKHAKYQLNEKDDVFGAMVLFEDIINIFLYILRAVNGATDD